MNIEEFNFNLPQELIAQKPFFPKEETKMLVCNKASILDSKIINLVDFLQEEDVLVFNDAKVIKAKLFAKIIRNGSDIEFNLDQEIFNKQNNKIIWQAICRGSKKIKEQDDIKIADDFFAKIIKKFDDGFCLLEFDKDNFYKKLEKYGSMPLPPYIKNKENDDKNYQTIYANRGNAVAAPTAGLHFNENIFNLLEKKGVKKVFITLNVGAGTFMPVRCEDIRDHKMHKEYFEISQETADIINKAKSRKSRIIAVGTTSLRALESASDENGKISKAKIDTNIFIYPPYKFKVVDILMTNFHLPKSTLFMLISAFIGKSKAHEIYQHAIKNKYRFFSYGDASLLIK